MQQKEAEILFHAGALKACNIYRHFDRAWCVDFIQKMPFAGMSDTLESKRGNIREIKDLGAAQRVVAEVGFTEATIHFT